MLSYFSCKVSGIPGVIGCIDGTYINFRCPDEKIPATYVNRHEALSLTLQGVCDDKHRFIDAFTGVSSRIHDARVFDLSDLPERLPTLCKRAKIHILGDATYPSREYLVTPFKDYGKMTCEQKDFNRLLCHMGDNRKHLSGTEAPLHAAVLP